MKLTDAELEEVSRHVHYLGLRRPVTTMDIALELIAARRVIQVARKWRHHEVDLFDALSAYDAEFGDKK